MIDPEIGMMVGRGWLYDLKPGVGGPQWTDPKNSDAKFIYKYSATDYGVVIPPKDAIWEQYGSIIARGGNVEYDDNNR